MEILIAIITIVWSILGIILFFKIWGMTNNVNDIHNWIMEERLKTQRYSRVYPPSFTPHSERGYEDLSSEAIPTKPFNGNLKKGDKVTIAEYGTCTFEGVWQGKYAFYPLDTSDLPKSPYLVNDVEPYLLIPADKLGNLIV